jgi:hypothetical protein
MWEVSVRDLSGMKVAVVYACLSAAGLDNVTHSFVVAGVGGSLGFYDHVPCNGSDGRGWAYLDSVLKLTHLSG